MGFSRKKIFSEIVTRIFGAREIIYLLGTGFDAPRSLKYPLAIYSHFKPSMVLVGCLYMINLVLKKRWSFVD